MERTTLPELTRLVREALKDAPPGEFRPCAFYNKRIDSITILTRDCSYVEKAPEMSTYGVYLLEDNYPEENEVKEIGFAIYRAKSFCEHHQLVADGKVPLKMLLETIAREISELTDAAWKITEVFSQSTAPVMIALT